MWVRTQDRERFIDCNKFELLDNEIIFSNSFNDFIYHLGTYATKERCLEVLDEIQAHINGWGIRVNGDALKTYQMPQEANL